ncbi:MAG: hybrid sensor histidine kinase/response regulator [Gemmatimonadales bacterium]
MSHPSDPGSPPPISLPPLGLTLEEIGRLTWTIEDYAIFILDPAGRIMSWNLGAARVTGYAAHEILEQPYRQVSRTAAGELEAAAAEGRYAEAGWRHRKDGSRFWSSVVVTALRDPAGSLRCFLVILRDLSSRLELEEQLRQAVAQAQREAELRARESEERFARFTRHLPGLAWIKDLEGRYVYVNGPCARAFGRLRAEIIGRTDAELFPPDTAAQFRENDRRALGAETGIQAVELLTDPTGAVRHSIISKFPIFDASGRPARVGGIAIDITERVRAEAALQEADRRKDEFLATLSHELRNALAPLRNSLFLAGSLDQAGTHQRLFQTMEDQLHRLVRLVDDLLEVSRITSGKIELRREPVSLSAVVESALDTSRPVIEGAGHRLEVTLPSEPIVLEADPVRLAQVISNLLNNAAKYTPEGGRIWLRARCEESDAVVSVRDDGLGIPAEMLDRVFEIFTQVDRTLKRAQEGLGIGLALARRLAELHGGRLEARSDGLYCGSEFVLRLPIPAGLTSPAAPTRGDESTSRAPPSIRVVVVDDSRDGADTLAMVLHTLGAEVRVAYDGLSALQTIREYRPSLVLLDLGMPGMDGYEVAYRIRGDPAIGPIRLVALTGFGSEEERRRALGSGFDEHCVKPADPALLRELLTSSARSAASR